MKFVNRRVQGSWLHRRGFRGRWVTVYFHQYNGREVTERLHSHPWRLAVGIVLKGWLKEVRYRSRLDKIWLTNPRPGIRRHRRFLSVGIYLRKTRHRVVDGKGTTVFVGFLRTQKPISRTATVYAKEGYCHYTEIMPNESGFRV